MSYPSFSVYGPYCETCGHKTQRHHDDGSGRKPCYGNGQKDSCRCSDLVLPELPESAAKNPVYGALSTAMEKQNKEP